MQQMVNEDAEKGDRQSSDREVKTTMFAEDEPPKEEWATYEVIENGKPVESFRVPFTQEELDTIKFLLKKKRDPDLLKGYVDGGPEREHRLALQVPFEHGLDNRKYAIDMLRETAQVADDIVNHGTFSPHLKSKEAVLAIRDGLKMFLPSEEGG